MVHRSELKFNGMAKRSILLLIGFLVFSSTSFILIEEPAFLKKLKENLTFFNKTYPEEKLYVQTDKSFYKPGEDIWLNVVVLNGNTHQATDVSDVVYVDLIDPKGNIASTLELVIQEGTANGDFRLAESAPGGIYKMRAFTKWMQNMGKDALFTKEIPVQRVITPRLLLKLDYEKESYGPGDSVKATLSITNLRNEKIEGAIAKVVGKLNNKLFQKNTYISNSKGEVLIQLVLPYTLRTSDGLLHAYVNTNGTEESISRSIPITLDKITLQLFPEGGHYVENVNSRIAFKAVNEYGNGADFKGVLVDEKDNIITTIESVHMGMGAFNITAAPGKEYFIRIEKPFNNSPPIPVPPPLPTGFSLQLKEINQSSIEWQVYSPANTSGFLVAQVHGEIHYSQALELYGGVNLVRVPTGNFPMGIAVFTLFDNAGIEQCERLVFLNRDKVMTVKLETDKKKYLPGEHVKLTVKTVDAKGKGSPAKISLSVIDEQLISFADDKQDNILSQMLLSSELRGKIQEPSFYFGPEEEKADSALDLLMMTHGWRRFKWSDILEPRKIISHAPEKIKNIQGFVLNEKGIGSTSEVTLLELGGKKRIVKLTTTKDGRFLFRNINPGIPILLLTKKPGEIVIERKHAHSVTLNDSEVTMHFPQAIVEEGILIPGEEPTRIETETIRSNLDLQLAGDVSQLSEVVVTGFGAENKSTLTGAVTYVSNQELNAAPSIEHALQGRVAGVMIHPQSGNPSGQANIMIRGMSSLSGGRGEPLYVIDGHPVGTSLSQNISNSSIVGLDAIQSVDVLTSATATALYGSAASNGAIFITTRSRIGYGFFNVKKKPSRYSAIKINSRNFSATREFYVPHQTKKKNDVREDFRTTVYWNHTIVTDKNGEATITFVNNDAVSAFRIIAEGFSGSGSIGRVEHVYHTELPLSLDAKLPEFLGFEDVMELPVYIRNETPASKTATVTLNIPDALMLEGLSSRKVSINPKTRETITFKIKSKSVQGEFPISIDVQSGDHNDRLDHVIMVRPIGFPMRYSFSAKELAKSVSFSIEDAEQNSIKAELTAFPDILSDLFAGAESILREPHGCFEQVSSSTFPNILALQYLRQSGLSKPETENVALKYIAEGYKQLIAYEIKGGGFEWFGHPPAHEGLTAYGILQFSEMKKVYPEVSDHVIDRTRKWLLSRRNGKGGFSQSKGKYGFSSASEEVTNAYIVYALTEIGERDIVPEYTQAYSEVLKSKDMYRMALLACAASNLGKHHDYKTLIDLFVEKIDRNGFDHLKADHSIVRGYGNSLRNEIIAQWCVALMKSSSPDSLTLNKCIKQLLRTRSYGQFGSTQATAVALKALAGYARLIRTTREEGSIQVYVNGALADQLDYEQESREKLSTDKIAQFLSTGLNDIQIRFAKTKNPLPYSLDVQWFTKKPQSSEECKVILSTSLGSSSVQVSGTARLTTSVKNTTDTGLPMTVAHIGIPAGMSVQAWQLKELQDKRVFDFYEIIDGNLVVYYREMPPKGQFTFNLDLKAEIPGSYLATASSAYLYYMNEHKYWVEGSKIEVRNN